MFNWLFGSSGTCPDCGGSGKIQHYGSDPWEGSCRKCNGSGRISNPVYKKCPCCSGSGYEMRKHDAKGSSHRSECCACHGSGEVLT